MKKLIMICPSRGRPDRIQEMLTSFCATKGDSTDMIIYVADDDPRIDEYRALKYPIEYGPRLSIVQIFNKYATQNRAPYYGEINDDHIFHTKGWDEIFITTIEQRGKGWGMAHGTESMTPANQPSGSVLSSKCIQALKYYANPRLEHLFVDHWFIAVYHKAGLLFKCPDVHIEHRHWTFNKAPKDSNYALYDSEEKVQKYKEIFDNIVRSDVKREIDILLQAMHDDRV